MYVDLRNLVAALRVGAGDEKAGCKQRGRSGKSSTWDARPSRGHSATYASNLDGVLRRAFQNVLRRVLRRCLTVGLEGIRVLRTALRRGSEKETSRRCSEGRTPPPGGARPLRRAPYKQPRNPGKACGTKKDMYIPSPSKILATGHFQGWGGVGWMIEGSCGRNL